MENVKEDWMEHLDKKWMVCEDDVEIGLENPYSLFYLFASPALQQYELQ